MHPILTSSAFVLGAVNNSIHVRPLLYMDAELPFVPDNDAPGASTYRSQIAEILAHYKSNPFPTKKSSPKSTKPARSSTSWS